MIRRPLLSVLAFTCLALAAEAGNGVWTPTTLYGNCCDSFLFHPTDPKLVYGTAGDLWISRNAGVSWKRLYLNNLPFVPEESNSVGFFVRIQRSLPSTVFVVYRGVLMRSVNQGATWQKLADLPFGRMTDFEMDSQNPNTLFAGSYSFANHPFIAFVHKSTNAGKSWNVVYQALGQRMSIETDPVNHLRVYALDTSGLRLSTDGGNTWAPFGTNVRKGGNHLTMDQRNPQNLYALFGDPFKSTDSGASWSSLPCHCFATSISVDPADSNAVYMTAVGAVGQAMKSNDAGETWAAVQVPSVSGFSPWNVAANRGIVLLWNLQSNVFRSTDSGTSWRIVTDGAGGSIRQLGAAGQSEVLALGSTFFKTANNGKQWLPLNHAFPGPTFSVGFFDVSPVNPARIALAGYRDDQQSSGYLLGISSDGGQAWAFQNANGWPIAAVFDPLDANAFFVLFERQIRKTTDLGQTWQEVANRFSHQRLKSMAIDPANSQILYVGSDKYRVYKSSNGGRTWDFRTLSSQRQPDTYVSLIKVNRTNPGVLYALADFVGWFKSTDTGQTWKAINSGLPLRDADGNNTSLQLRFLTFDPHDSDSIYTGGDASADLLQQPALFVSHDAGGHWQLSTDTAGLPRGFFPVSDLVFGTSNPDMVFLSSYSGVYSMTRAR